MPQYCRETGQSAEKRFCGHRNTVVQTCHQNTKLAFGEHFQKAGHSVSDVCFTPVEKIYSTNVFVRKAREKHLIMNNLYEEGLNIKL